MEKQYEKKITWCIKNFSSLKSDIIYSDQFVVGSCKWCLRVYPKGNKDANYLSLFLEVADSESLPCGWRRHAKFRLTVLNQHLEALSEKEGAQMWFDHKSPTLGFRDFISLKLLHDKDGGFLVNDELKVVAEVDVIEAIEISSDVLKETSYVVETIDVNGFQVLPSQVESLRVMFERHPDIAEEFRAKNKHLRKSCMSFLLSLIETLCQSLEELNKEDVVEADIALTYLKDAGFKVDWLEKILDQVKVKKEKEQVCLSRLQEMEDSLLKLKQQCSEMFDLVQEEKVVLSATRTPLSFDAVV